MSFFGGRNIERSRLLNRASLDKTSGVAAITRAWFFGVTASGNITLAPAPAVISLAGQNSKLSRAIAAQPGTVSITGLTSALRRVVVSTPAIIALAPRTAALSRFIISTPATLALTGRSSPLARAIISVHGTLTVNGQTSTVTIGSAGNVLITSTPALLTIVGMTSIVTVTGGIILEPSRRLSEAYMDARAEQLIYSERFKL